MPKLKLKFNLTPHDNILLIDAKYLVYRTQYSKNVSGLSYQGIKTGLNFGFYNTIRSLITKFNPINLIMFWDGEGSKRKEEYPEYKNRNNFKYLTEEQINTLKEIKIEYPNIIKRCHEFGFVSYILDMYEADDLLAIFVNQYPELNKIIITRDEDMYQCINKTTIIYNPDDKIKKDYNWFKKTYDIEPEQWALIKCWAGCSSDNVPGIKGVAEKTAIKIIKGDKTASKKLDSADKKELELWGHLTKLPHSDLINYSLPYKITKFNTNNFIGFCQQNNFRSLLERISEFKILK